MAESRLYDPSWFEPLSQGKVVSFRTEEYPDEEMDYLKMMGEIYPGLMFNLRKMRGKCYILTISPWRHLDREREEVKGEP